jgi:flagellin-like hook-associated protein FlgL
VEVGNQLQTLVGDGTFAPATYIASYDPWTVVTGDINGDGLADIVSTNYADTTLSIIIGNGNGTFKVDQTYAASTWVPFGATLGDLNGDGALDIVVTDLGIPYIGVLFNNGDGTFSARTSYQAPSGCLTGFSNVTLGDLNGDSSLDIIATCSGSDAIQVFLNGGSGTFIPSLSFAAGDSAFDLTSADFNGDGLDDIAVTNRSDGTITIFESIGDGTLEQVSLLSAGPGDWPRGIRAEDMNNDGIIDVVTALNQANVVGIFWGSGNGMFETIQTEAVGNEPFGIEVADFNGDGIIDIASADVAGGTLSVLVGKGNGSFDPAVSYAAGGKAVTIAAADFNSDGVTDLITTNNTNNRLAIFLGDTKYSMEMTYLSFYDTEKSTEAIETIATYRNRVSAELGNIGAAQSRLAHTVNHLQVMRENYAAANSKIVDADIAEEVAQMVRQQILQQAITAVMAQANQQPALVLELLK